MSDPDLDLIQGAASALNTTDARINGFLDSVDDEVDARLTVAETELGQRQAAYDALATNLIDVVSDRMEITIDYRPDVAVADLQPGGHFTTWEELITLANAAPPHSRLIVRLPDNTVLRNTSRFHEHLYGPRHWVFKSKTPSAIGPHTPVFEIAGYDGVTYNQYLHLELGQLGTFQAEYLKFRWEPVTNPSLPFTVNTPLIHYRANNMVSLSFCEIANNDGLVFARLINGSIGKMALQNVTLNGNMTCLGRMGVSNVAMLSCSVVTTLNTAAIYDTTFVVGSTLITN